MPARQEIPTVTGESLKGIPPVPIALHHVNREKLKNRLKEVAPKSVVILQGGDHVNHYNTDTVYQFRQESYFLWLFGVREPEYYGILDVNSGDSILFMPRYPEEYATWMGPIPTPSLVTEKYGVTATHYIDEMDAVLEKIKPEVLLLLTGNNTDSGLTLPSAEIPNKHGYKQDTEILHPIISECRVIKSREEIEMITAACALSCEAHKYVMKMIKNCSYQYQAESLFMHWCYYMGGARSTAYTNNCSSGACGAILHYGDAGAPNDKPFHPGDMCLFDMGASFSGYASDITISFPYTGIFTPDQKLIYNAVLSARNAVIESLKPGVSWVDMHTLANKVILTTLAENNLLKGNVDEMMKAGLSRIFQPHGLGHLLGIDVHDVGGYLETSPERPKEAWLNKLRTARVMKEGIVLTVEPGCYFIEPLLDEALADESLSKYLVKDVINRFRSFGGVRIEDVVVVTEDGCRVLSPLPRKVEEIEALMKDDGKELPLKTEMPRAKVPKIS